MEFTEVQLSMLGGTTVAACRISIRSEKEQVQRVDPHVSCGMTCLGHSTVSLPPDLEQCGKLLLSFSPQGQSPFPMSPGWQQNVLERAGLGVEILVCNEMNQLCGRRQVPSPL